MIKKVPDQLWFPFWVDKWIFGSMRIEFSPEERAVWVDLLALAAKDNGYIRANEETPYSMRQLAGLLVYDEAFFSKTISKFIEKNKLECDRNEVLYITNWEKYRFSDSYKRVLDYRKKKDDETENVTGETENVTGETENVTGETKNVSHNITKHNITKHNITYKNYSATEIEKRWEKWWKRYPRKEDMGKAKEKYLLNIEKHKVDPDILDKALTGYLNVEKSKKTDRFYIKHAKTFLYQGNKKRKIPPTWEQYLRYADPKFKLKPDL